MRLVVLAVALSLATPALAATSVVVDNGNIVCIDAGGRRQAVTSRGDFDQPVLSPDGHTVAFLHEDKRDDMPGGKAGALWAGDCIHHNSRRLLPSAYTGDGDQDSWGALDKPSFSLDGRHVYLSAFYGGDGGMVHRVDIGSGAEAYIFPAELIGVIHAGPYRGGLLATQHTLLKDRKGSDYAGYPVYVFTAEGQEQLRVPDSENWDRKALDAWLEKKGWQVW